MRGATSESEDIPGRLTRRGLLTGAAVAGGLAVAWTVWPRATGPAPALAPGEHALSGYLKLGTDGHVTCLMPQVELGQGNTTLIAQTLADELGADWRTIAIEPAPVNAHYSNPVLSAQWSAARWTNISVQGTEESQSLALLEPILRQSAAAARVLLCMAAGERWGAHWSACTTQDGFVIRGNDKLRFSELADQAATLKLPEDIPLRSAPRPLTGQRLPRLDVPAKLDGSVTFAADIRLADLAFAAIRMAPMPGSTLQSHDEKAARATPGFAGIVTGEDWIAVAANSFWAAENAVKAAKPQFSAPGSKKAADSAVRSALDSALKESGSRMLKSGDPDDALKDKPVERLYRAHFAPHMALEPMAATAALTGDQMQLWMPAQLPAAARKAAAAATGLSEDDVFIHAIQGGGSFGRRYEVTIAAQVALIAQKLNRPVQLCWSRAEDFAQERPRPAAAAKVSARLVAGGRIEALRLSLATSDAQAQLEARVAGDSPENALEAGTDTARAETVWSGAFPYSIADWSIDLHPAALPVACGPVRGGASGFSCFFLESFIDEMARVSNLDPFSMRMGMLSGNPRLAACLSKVATRGGWVGGTQGAGQGLACHSALDGHIAVLAEARMDEQQRVRVSRLVAVADVGRMINPEIALQQVEGGLLHGMALASIAPFGPKSGRLAPDSVGALNWPRLFDMPDISVEIVSSAERPGPIGDIGLPAVAPAIANAIAAASGQRFRTLPLGSA